MKQIDGLYKYTYIMPVILSGLLMEHTLTF